MSPNKLTNEEMGALLGAFADMHQDLSGTVNQTVLFKACLIFSNVCVVLFTVLYILLRENIITASSPQLLGEGFLTAFGGKIFVMFWLLAGVNMSLYFNVGFRILCLCGVIYLLNGVVDGLVLFHDIIYFSEAPYFLMFMATSTSLIFAMAVMAFSYKTADQKP
jgi:hypothetical protein